MNQTSSFCDTCGASNPATSRFCHTCGQTLLHHLTPTGSLPAAHLLQQRYRVIKKLGQGGFGAIYLVEDTQFPGAFRALKEMRNQYLSFQERQDAVATFQHEARLLATLMHPHLPRVYESFEENGRWYLTMDYIDGETLQERLLKTPHGTFLAREVLPLALQLCAALDYLHSHQPPVIFRDMKPTNVMVNGQDHLYLIDFGIARFFRPGQGKDTIALGSVGYAAPEQYGKTQSSTASDIYGLGATLHHLLSGEDPSEHPFTFSPLQIHPQDAPYARELADLVQQMVQIPVEKRPGSIQEIRQHLLRMEQHTQPPGAPLAPSATNAPALDPEGSPIPEMEETLCILQGEKGTIDPDVPCTLAWMRDSQHLICGGFLLLTCWNITTQIASPIIESTVEHLACSLDYTYLAMSERNEYDPSCAGSVSLIDLRTYERILTTPHQGPAIADLRQQGAWQHVSFGTPQIKNLINFVGISTLAKKEKLSAIALSPHGETLAVGTTNGGVYLWDVQRKLLAGSCQAHSKAVTALSWSPDGSKLASGSEDTELHILAMSKMVQRFKGERNILGIQATSKEYRQHIIRAVAWSPDGQYIAVAGEVGGVLLCDASGRSKLGSSYPRLFSIRALCWSPDSKSLAATGSDNTISIWEIQEQSNFWDGTSWIIKQTSLECVGIYSKHRKWIYTAQWSPDGKYIASCDALRTIHIWKAPVFSLCSTGPVKATPCPVHGQPVTITYHGRLASSATSLTMHWGYNHWNGITDTSMTRQSTSTWSAIITLPAGATALNMAFFNQSHTWDNNMGHNYDLDVL